MKIEGSTLQLDAGERHRSALMGLELPAGSAAGGLLVPDDDVLFFLLFADEELDVGDEVVASSRRRFTVTSVRHATLDDEPITVLEIRPR